MKRLPIPFSAAMRSIGRWAPKIFTALMLSLSGVTSGGLLHAELQWRTPDRLVVPAADIAQEEPQNPLPDDPQISQPHSPHVPDPATSRSTAFPMEATADDSDSYPEPGGDAYDNRPWQPRESWIWDPCWNPLANRVEVRADWLLWWGKGNSVPPLVTTSPSSTPRAQAGVLGDPGTSILFGNSDLNVAARSGARIDLDCWLTSDHSLGLEVQYFGLADNTQSFQGDNNTYPVLARPFYNTQTSAADAELVAFPGVQTGSVSVTATTGLQGVEALLRQTWYRCCDAHLDFLAGYRYVRLSDDLRVDELTTFIDPQGTVPVGSTLALTDRFSTLNEFQGADLGLTSDWSYGRWNLGVLLKVGLGNTSSHVSISGSTVATEPTLTPVGSQGAFLAQASNSGQYQRNQFTMLPELGLNFGFDLTRRLRLTGGYSLLYWGAVARTGGQVDLDLAPAQFPPAQGAPAGHFPTFPFAFTDYWAQGLNLGLDFRF